MSRKTWGNFGHFLHFSQQDNFNSIQYPNLDLVYVKTQSFQSLFPWLSRDVLIIIYDRNIQNLGEFSFLLKLTNGSIALKSFSSFIKFLNEFHSEITIFLVIDYVISNVRLYQTNRLNNFPWSENLNISFWLNQLLTYLFIQLLTHCIGFIDHRKQFE